MDIGNLEAAIKDFTLAIMLVPNCTLAYYNRGKAYYFKMNFDKATIDYRQAKRLDPSLETYDKYEKADPN